MKASRFRFWHGEEYHEVMYHITISVDYNTRDTAVRYLPAEIIPIKVDGKFYHHHADPVW